MSILKTNRLRLCREVSGVGNHMKYINTAQQGAENYVLAGGTHNHHWISEG